MNGKLVMSIACWLLAAQFVCGQEGLPIGLVNVDRILKEHKPLQEKLVERRHHDQLARMP